MTIPLSQTSSWCVLNASLQCRNAATLQCNKCLRKELTFLGWIFNLLPAVSKSRPSVWPELARNAWRLCRSWSLVGTWITLTVTGSCFDEFIINGMNLVRLICECIEMSLLMMQIESIYHLKHSVTLLGRKISRQNYD